MESLCGHCDSSFNPFEYLDHFGSGFSHFESVSGHLKFHISNFESSIFLIILNPVVTELSLVIFSLVLILLSLFVCILSPF